MKKNVLFYVALLPILKIYLFIPYGKAICQNLIYFYANKCNIHYYIIEIKMKQFAKKYTFLLGKNTIIGAKGAKGAKVLVVFQGQGWSNINTWPQFIGIIHEINTLHHKK